MTRLRLLLLLQLCSTSSFVLQIPPRVSLLQRAATDRKVLETDLPIGAVLDQVRQSVVPNLLLEAPPGAGKTTVIPLVMMELVEGSIIVVEPRRVATRSAAQRMASMLQEKAGETVGYVMRGESRTGSQTRVTVMTDGVLLNKLREDPELSGVDVIIFDEFHERGVGSDTALALSIEAQRQLRPDDLKIIVMSATLLGDTGKEDSTGGKLVTVLGGNEKCSVLTSNGRQFPIEIKWANQITSLKLTPLGSLIARRDLLVETICDAIEQGLKMTHGDVLAFLPGAAEIRRVVNELNKRGVPSNAEVLPLYGALPKDQQDYAIYPSPITQRRVIVSSPIAEASLTLERVTCVVDSGLRREPRCDVDTGMPRLITTRCSKASAVQRAGRAGRVQAGLCLRVYTESEFNNRFLEQSPPEIESTDLSPTLLLLADWGCSTVSEVLTGLPFVDAPDEASLMKAFDLLRNLKALEWKDDGRFVATRHGQYIAKVPSHPRIATTIAKATDDMTLAAAVVAAYLLDDEVGARPGDTIDLLPRVRDVFQSKGGLQSNVLKFAARMTGTAKNAVQKVFAGDIALEDVTACLGRALLPGFIDLVAQRKGDASYGGSTYMLSLGRSARLDGVRDASEFIVVVSTSTGDDGTARIRGFVSIDEEALLDVAVKRDVVFTVPSRGHEVRARRVLEVGNLELSSQPLPAPTAGEVTSILIDTIRNLGGVNAALLQTLPPDKRKPIQQMRGRLRLATKLADDPSAWPESFAALEAEESRCGSEDDALILEDLVEPWLAAAGSLKKINLYEILRGSLTSSQKQQLDMEYPEKINAPDGSLVPITYRDDTPFASGKLQQFFGTVDSPTVGPSSKKIPVSLSLLSPAGKPLAETKDLAFFWKEAYPSARAEMRGRYPKHPWPEDPLQAVATKKTKKQQALTSASNEPAKLTKKKKRGKKR